MDLFYGKRIATAEEELFRRRILWPYRSAPVTHRVIVPIHNSTGKKTDLAKTGSGQST
eukprot:COSAG06_NODE_18107_length_903_cov_26.370259_1_plen_58_part_00